MASFAGRGPEALTRSSAASPQALRPATPSRNLQCDQKVPIDKDALVAFAVKATIALREESSFLAKQPKPSPFFPVLSSQLSDVEGRLDRTASLTEPRVSRLLVDLERLAKAISAGVPSTVSQYR
jgi:hypothetical protein